MEETVPTPQSSSLLGLVREALKRRGWNTAALAQKMDRDRSSVRSILAGQTPLLVDDFLAMLMALELSAQEISRMLPAGAEAATQPDDAAGPEPAPLRLATEADAAFPDTGSIDPDAPHAEQLLRTGFGLGVDMHVVADTAQLEGSGVPKEVLARFPERLVIKLDAAWHRHMRPRYLPEGVELRLSFDRVYPCFFPWSSIRQISFFPEPPLVPTDEGPSGPPDPKGRPVLRLVT
jgi:hypothetical protein